MGDTLMRSRHRMADWDFGRATTWTDLLATHGHWVVSYNNQNHWAHRSPASVLAWVHGRAVRGIAARLLRHPFGHAGGSREICEVPPLAPRRRASHRRFADKSLAQYHDTYQPDKRHLKLDNEYSFSLPLRSHNPPYSDTLGWLTLRFLSHGEEA